MTTPMADRVVTRGGGVANGQAVTDGQATTDGPSAADGVVVADEETYPSFTLTPLTGSIGAEITGLQVDRPLERGAADDLRRALARYLVLFLRDQPLTDEQHLALARVFGEPNVYPATRARGLDVALEWIEDGPDSPPKADLWHTDAAFLPRPPDVGIITMLDVPPVGGDTMWLNLYAVYEALSEPMRRVVDQLDQDLHPGPDMKAKLELQFGPGIYEKVADEFAGARHPLVRVHPVTGRRALFMCGAYVKGVAGMSTAESDAVLALLRAGLHDPNHQVRWRWQPGDMAIWDERCTNHRGLGDHYPAHRLIRRCTTGVGVPQGPPR